MTFQVGDNVVYPSQGAGVVEEMTTREVLGETQQYLKIVFVRGDMEVLVPLRKGQEVGLRHTVGRDEIDQVYEALAKADLSLPTQWPPRYRAEQDILAGLQQDQLGAARERVSRLLARRDQIDDLLLDIQGLQAQLEGLPAGDLLTAGQKFALFTLEASAFGAELPDLGYTLELSESALQGDEITVQQALGLLGRLAATLQAAYADAQAALETQSSALLEGRCFECPSGSST
ncbi:MAG: CarD family transcriptional regulator [Deinococcales bacterium]